MARLNIQKIRKDEVVRVATRLVARKGWQNTTLADIAREAKVSLGVITYHFSGKDEIIRSVMEKYVGENLTQIFESLEEYDDPVEKLKNLVRLTLRETKRDKEIYYVHFDYWAKISWNDEIREMNAQFYDFARDWTADCVRRGIEAGVFKEVDPREAATLINSLLIGIQAQHAFDEEAFDFERVAEMAERAVLDYLLT
jgi:AcrR family transcriptional regulator